METLDYVSSNISFNNHLGEKPTEYCTLLQPTPGIESRPPAQQASAQSPLPLRKIGFLNQKLFCSQLVFGDALLPEKDI